MSNFSVTEIGNLHGLALSADDHLRYSEKTFRYADGKVWINEMQYFTDVLEAVWRYEIGSYQVCRKWLLDRRGEALGYVEVREYCVVLISLAEALRLTAAIDEWWAI